MHIFEGGIRADIQQMTNRSSPTSFSFLKVRSIHSLMLFFLNVLNEIVIKFSILQTKVVLGNKNV